MTLYVRQQKRHRCTEQTLGSWEEAEGRMVWEGSVETCILYVKQITSPGLMHETGCWGWCTGMTQRDGMRREVGGGRTHVRPWLIHYNVWQKPLQYCKVISLKLKLFFFKKESQFPSLKEEMVPHSSILAWKIPRTEEPGRLQSMELPKSRTWLSDWTTNSVYLWDLQSIPIKMKLEPIIQSEVSQKEKHQYSILMHIHGI